MPSWRHEAGSGRSQGHVTLSAGHVTLPLTAGATAEPPPLIGCRGHHSLQADWSVSPSVVMYIQCM